MSIQIIQTDASHTDFLFLVKQLDAYLAIIDGDEHAFYSNYNKVDNLKYVVLIYVDHSPAACGALKLLNNQTAEIKRMFVQPRYRNKGLATTVLQVLEEWAQSLHCNKIILETGKRMTDAVAFYHKNNYQVIDNYGQYIGVENSICFEKRI